MPHVFNVSVDLRSVKDVQSTSGQIFLKYTCPQVFDSQKPFFTNLIAPRKTETLMPHSYAMYEIVTPRSTMLAALCAQVTHAH